MNETIRKAPHSPQNYSEIEAQFERIKGHIIFLERLLRRGIEDGHSILVINGAQICNRIRGVVNERVSKTVEDEPNFNRITEGLIEDTELMLNNLDSEIDAEFVLDSKLAVYGVKQSVRSAISRLRIDLDPPLKISKDFVASIEDAILEELDQLETKLELPDKSIKIDTRVFMVPDYRELDDKQKLRLRRQLLLLEKRHDLGALFANLNDFEHDPYHNPKLLRAMQINPEVARQVSEILGFLVAFEGLKKALWTPDPTEIARMEEDQLWSIYIEGGRTNIFIRDHLATQYFSMAERMGHSMGRRHSISSSDALGEAHEALMTAIQKHDPSRGAFKTTLWWYVKAAISLYKIKNSGVMRVPGAANDDTRNYGKILREILNAGEEVNLENIMRYGLLNEKEARRLIKRREKARKSRGISLEQPIGFDGFTVKDTIGVELDPLNPPGSAEIRGNIFWETLEKMINSSSEFRSRPISPMTFYMIFESRYLEGITLAELGRKLSYSRERIRQFEQEILLFIRNNPQLKNLAVEILG